MSIARPTKPTPTSDPVRAYARAVISHKEVAGPHVRDACRRHLNDLKYGRARGLKWDGKAAQRAIDFFHDVLNLNGGEFEGKPFNLLPWQQFVVGSIFGWKREDGTRRYREVYIEAGKGSGKSPLAAGIGLYMLVADGEARAEVYAAATRRDQAMVLFRDAVAMVQLSPALASRTTLSGRDDRVWNIAYVKTGSFFRPIASDDSGQSGPRPHCGLIDEVHEHKSPTVINIMRAGKKGRRQPLILMITNSGFDRTTVCYEQHEYGARVSSGVIDDDAYFAYVCALDEGEEPFDDESCWIKANPSLGSTIENNYLREQVRQARGMPSLESTVRRLNFCQWVDAADPWISADLWCKCEVGAPPIAQPAGEQDADRESRWSKVIEDAMREREALFERMKGRRIAGGLDLSGTRDLTALAIAAEQDDGSVDALVEFWTPADTLRDRAQHDRVPYEAWVKAGFLHASKGRAVDYGDVVRRLAALDAELAIGGLAFDPYRIKYFERDLDAENVDIKLVPHGQGFFRAAESGLWMPRSIEQVEQLVFEKKLRVAFNPCLRWNVLSTVTETDAKNNRIFNKRKATGRIDGLVALTMAIALLLEGKNEREPEYQIFFV
ncbi:terminase TerL endonuclease subunit [Caballeronia sp. ATUFL_F1_KS39]|uniref:terminase large subunit n=1 Tax=Caballeronia sp. ATUFL_F1_KS39 TaxID=2921766 RepID=UPI00202799B1|nr:terminase TerL endonuclease subunit [Caballeronia sp. ATUFL_F1_KS39]